MGDGFITNAECRVALDRLDREISDGVVREPMWSSGHKDEGVVDYFEFMGLLLERPHDHVECDHSGNKFDSVDTLLKHCTRPHADASIANDLTRQAKMELIKSFKHIDVDDDGFISPEELRVALRAMSPDSTTAHIEENLGRM